MKPTIAEITNAVCSAFKLEDWMLKGRESHRHISRPRAIAFLLAADAGATHGTIARQFKRDRSTVSAAIASTRASIATDFNTAVKIEALRFILGRKTA